MLEHLDERANLRIAGPSWDKIRPQPESIHRAIVGETKVPGTFFAGGDIPKAKPVPIPNTVVKLSEPMVVPRVRE